MSQQVTLESLAERIAAIEAQLALQRQPQEARDWRKTIGLVKDSEFMREVDELGRQYRKAQRLEDME